MSLITFIQLADAAIQPGMEPNDLYLRGNIKVGFIAAQLLKHLAEYEAEGKGSLSPPENIKNELVYLADPFLNKNFLETYSNLEQAFAGWATWFQYNNVRSYCNRYDIGELEQLSEPTYTGSDITLFLSKKNAYLQKYPEYQ